DTAWWGELTCHFFVSTVLLCEVEASGAVRVSSPSKHAALNHFLDSVVFIDIIADINLYWARYY
ncbi:MAG: hypothetical protein ABI670_06000, partial [Chloroflexota bacterium]